MSDKNNNAATLGVAALQSDFDAKTAILNSLDETAAPEVRTAAQADVDAAKIALDEAIQAATLPGKNQTGKTKEKTVKGVFVLSPTGRFNLGYNAGEKASLPELQAIELEASGYFKIDK